MKFTSENTADHQVKLAVEIEPDQLQGAKEQAARKIAARVKVPGFRPGKAPYAVIEKQVGPEAILEEAIDILVDKVYPEVIEEAKIDPYGPGKLEKIPAEDSKTFEFLVPLAPEVKLGNYRKLRIDYTAKRVTDKDIEDSLKSLLDSAAVLEPAARAAQENDMVYILLSGVRTDKAEDDPERTFVSQRRYPVIIEKADVDSKDEWPYPGFSRQLIGLSSGDEKTVTHKFGKDYEFEELRGAPVEFTVKVEEIKSRVLPALDDEFARSMGEYNTLDELRQEIRTSLEKRNQEELDADYEEKIMSNLLEESTMKYPPQMVDHEVDHVLEDLVRRLSYQGVDIDTYLKSRQMEMSALREELRPTAEDRIRRGLVIMEVANAENISVTAKDVEGQTLQTIGEIDRAFSKRDAQRLKSRESLRGLVSRIMSDEVIKRTFARLSLIARGEPVPAPEATAEQAAEPAS